MILPSGILQYFTAFLSRLFYARAGQPPSNLKAA